MSVQLPLVAATILLATAPALGHAAESEHLNVQLVSDTDSVQPGKPLLAGLYFVMDKGWHIYWRNPGDSGEPPRVEWRLPAGFQAGEIQWPAPARLGSGSVVDYGYEAPVLLPVAIQTSNNPSLNGNVTLSVNVTWLVCKDICVPGKAALTLSLPIGSMPGSATASHLLFQDAKSRVPKPLPPGWKIDATSEKDYFVLTIHGASIAKALFFPFESDQIDNAAPQPTSALHGGLRLILKNSDRLLKPPANLDGVLEIGAGRAYVVSAPIHSRSD